MALTPRRRHPASVLGWAVLLLVLFVTLIWPALMLGLGAFRTESPLVDGSWSLDAFRRLHNTLLADGALRNSVFLSVLTTIVGVALAFVLAILSERTDSALRGIIRPLVTTSVATSAMFYAIGYDQLANPFTGVVNSAANAAFGIESVVNVESWPGLVFVDSLHASAYIFLFLIGPIRALDRTQEEAALVSGASRWRVLWTIDVPLLAPILTSVVLIGVVAGLQSFDSPLILGQPADLSFLGTRIWSLLHAENPPRYADASAIAFVLLVVVIGLAVVQTRVLRGRSFVTVTGKSYMQTTWTLGRGRYLGGAFVSLYALFAVILPFSAVIISSFQPFPGVWQSMSTQNYVNLLQNDRVAPAAATTVLLAAVGGLLATSMSFIVAAVSLRSRSHLGPMLRAVTLLPLAMPGVVAAVAVIWAYASVPGLRQLYGTVWLLMIALIVAILPITVQIATGALRQVSSELEDASRVAGAGRARAVLTITVRLLLPSLLAGWFLAAVLIVGNLDAPLILSTSGTETLSTITYQMFSNQNQGQAAALLTLTVGTLVVLGGLTTICLRLINASRPRLHVPSHASSSRDEDVRGQHPVGSSSDERPTPSPAQLTDSRSGS